MFCFFSENLPYKVQGVCVLHEMFSLAEQRGEGNIWRLFWCGFLQFFFFKITFSYFPSGLTEVFVVVAVLTFESFFRNKFIFWREKVDKLLQLEVRTVFAGTYLPDVDFSNISQIWSVLSLWTCTNIYLSLVTEEEFLFDLAGSLIIQWAANWPTESAHGPF